MKRPPSTTWPDRKPEIQIPAKMAVGNWLVAAFVGILVGCVATPQLPKVIESIKAGSRAGKRMVPGELVVTVVATNKLTLSWYAVTNTFYTIGFTTDLRKPYTEIWRGDLFYAPGTEMTNRIIGTAVGRSNMHATYYPPTDDLGSRSGRCEWEDSMTNGIITIPVYVTNLPDGYFRLQARSLYTVPTPKLQIFAKKEQLDGATGRMNTNDAGFSR
jgi:hypothetical protein